MAEREEDPLLPVSEVAKRFSVSDQTIYRWIDDGLLPVVKVRRLLRIRTSDVDRLLDGRFAARASAGWELDGCAARGSEDAVSEPEDQREPVASEGVRERALSLSDAAEVAWSTAIRGHLLAPPDAGFPVRLRALAAAARQRARGCPRGGGGASSVGADAGRGPQPTAA